MELKVEEEKEAKNGKNQERKKNKGEGRRGGIKEMGKKQIRKTRREIK